MGANVKAKNLANETPFDDVIRNNNLSSLSKKVQDALNADLWTWQVTKARGEEKHQSYYFDYDVQWVFTPLTNVVS